ncbi:RNA-binding domain-containing protein [Methanocaldococcus indicus]|uniref:RNA-binding domain-containing protein n=1 Tax=Methanocaldococcus indicus TaxID=213231 RepID=UPI003C6CFAA5
MLNYVKLSSIVHATEDLDKVMEAIEFLIPEDINDEKVEVNVVESEGHFRNPIKLVEITIKGKDAEKTFKHIFNLIKSDEKNINKLKKDLHLRIEDNKFFVRFDKQKAYLGKCKVIDGDDIIRVMFNFKIFGKDKESKTKEIVESELNA